MQRIDINALPLASKLFSLHDAPVLAWRVMISELPVPSNDYFLLLFSLQNVELGSRLC